MFLFRRKRPISDPQVAKLSTHQVETLGLIFWQGNTPTTIREMRGTLMDICALPETAEDEQALA